MKIIETSIDELSKVSVVNGILQLTIGSRLHTERVNPSNCSDATWEDGKAFFTITTAIGTVDVQTTALEWQAMRTTTNPIQNAYQSIVAGAQNFKTMVTGGSCCKGNR